MLSNQKIASRLMIGFGVLIVLIIALVGYTTVSGKSSGATVDQAFTVKHSETLSEKALKRLFQARTQLWIALGTGDESRWQKAEEAFKVAHERVDQLVANTIVPERKAKAQEFAASVAAFEAAAMKLRAFKGRSTALDTPEAAAAAAATTALGIKVDELGTAMSSDYEQGANATVAEARNGMERTIVVSVVVGAICTLIGILFAWLLIRSVVPPVRRITETMGRLAKHDLTVEVNGRDRKDEIGAMAQAVQVFKDNMIEGDRLAEAQKAEQIAKEERAKTVNALTAAFDANIGAVVQSVSSQAVEMESSAQSLSATAEESTRQASAVAAASEQAAANVQTVASAAEELSSSIAEISRQVAQSSKVSATAVGEAERANQMVQGLVEASQKISAVVALITDIANQTNLLALNATIEAARAGEAGKGFAVVAAEVKNLATQTARATEEISGQITGVQSATQEAVQAIQGIGKTIAEISGIASTIAAAVEEQSAATKEIARNVEQAATGTKEVTSNITGVSQAANDTGSASSQVLASARDLAQQSDTLKSVVNKFLTEVKAA